MLGLKKILVNRLLSYPDPIAELRICIAEFWLYSDNVWEQAEELQEQRQGQWRTAEKKERGCWTLMNPSVSIVVYGRSLLSCGRTRRMTCCPRGGMLDPTKTWLWGEILNHMLGKPSLLSPLQENKQSPLLSIEEIQNGIQSPDGHKQLQVICWNFAPFLCASKPSFFLFQSDHCNSLLRPPSPRERSWAVRGTLRSMWWST